MLDRHSPPLGTPAPGRYHLEGSMLLDGGAGGGASATRDPPGTLNLSSLRQSPPRRHASATSFEGMPSGVEGVMGASSSASSSVLLSIASRRAAGDILLENAGSKAQERLDMDRAKSMLRESYLEIERLQAHADSVGVQLRESEFRRRVGEDKLRGELEATLARNAQLDARVRVAEEQSKRFRHALALKEDECVRLAGENRAVQATAQDRTVEGRRRMADVQRQASHLQEQKTSMEKSLNECQAVNEELRQTVEELKRQVRQGTLDLESTKRMLAEAESMPRAPLPDQDAMAREEREALKRHLMLSEQSGEALGRELELLRREAEALRRDRDDAESQRMHATKRLLEAEAELSALHAEQSRVAQESVTMIKTCLQFRARVSDFAMSAKRPNTRKVVVLWSCAVARMRTARARIGWVVRVVKMRECREAFAGWMRAVWIERRRSQVGTAAKVMERMFTRKREEDAASALGAWSMLVRQRRAAGTRVGARLRRLLMGSLAQGFEGWAEGVRACKQERMRESKAGKIMRAWAWGCAAEAMAAWSGRCAALRVQRKKVAAVAMRLGPGAAVGRGLNTWRVRVREIRRQRGLVARVAGRMMGRCVAVALETWIDKAREMRRSRGVLQKVAMRFACRVQAMALDLWRDNVVEMRRQGAVMARVILRLNMAGLVQAFKMLQVHAAEQRRQKSVCSRVLQRMMARGLALAFETWHENTAEHKKQNAVMAKVVKRFFTLALAMAFARWEENAKEHKRQRNVCARVIQRMRTRGVAMAFEMWADNAAEASKNRAIVGRVAFRFRQGAVVAAFARWVDVVHEMKRQAAVLGRVLTAMTKGAMVTAFMLWKENAEEAKGQRGLAGRIVSMLMNRSVSRAFMRWREVAGSARRARVCVVKMMRRGLATAFDAWKQRVLENARMMGVLRGAIVRIQNMGLASAFEAWRQGAEEARKSAAIIGKVLKRMTQAGLIRSLNCWVGAVSQTRIARRAVARLQSGSLARFLDRWRESVGEGRAIMQAVAERFVVHDPERADALRMCRMLRAWSDASVHLFMARVRVLAAVGRRHDASLASRIMRCWKEEVLEAREECLGIVRGSAEALSSHFVAWRGVLEEISRLSRGIVACAAAWRARLMFRTLDTWAMSTRVCRQEARVAAALEVMPRDKVLMVRAMHCWRGAAAVFARERMLEEAQEAIDSEQNLLLAFSAWKMMGFADGLDEEEEERVRAEEEHKAMERLRMRLEMMHIAVCTRTCSHVLRAWHWVRTMNQHMVSFCKGKMRLHLTKIIRSWMAYSKLQARISVFVGHIGHRLRRRWLHEWFGAWVQRTKAVYALTNLIKRRVKAVESRGLWAWRCTSREGKGRARVEAEQMQRMGRGWRVFRDGVSASKEERAVAEFGGMLRGILYVFGEAALAAFDQECRGARTVEGLMRATALFHQMAGEMRGKSKHGPPRVTVPPPPPPPPPTPPTPPPSAAQEPATAPAAVSAAKSVSAPPPLAKSAYSERRGYSDAEIRAQKVVSSNGRGASGAASPSPRMLSSSSATASMARSGARGYATGNDPWSDDEEAHRGVRRALERSGGSSRVVQESPHRDGQRGGGWI